MVQKHDRILIIDRRPSCVGQRGLENEFALNNTQNIFMQFIKKYNL